MTIFTVGVFAPVKVGQKYLAYLSLYNPAWPGCCLHKVEAPNGTRAKIEAINQHKKTCVKDGSLENVSKEVR